MDNQLLKLFVWNSLTHLCLSASISAAPSTTPACFPGSSYVHDCMSYTCDENGQWQEFEFTRTDECCLKSHHPGCAGWDTTSSGRPITKFDHDKLTLTVKEMSENVCFCYVEVGGIGCEFMVTTESPPTTTSTPLCDSGSMKSEDCRMFFCQDGQWQVGEFTATRECCLQTFHPKCQAMGFTSTDQATGITSTEFIVTTESPPTTTSTPLCDSDSMKSEDCRIFFCHDGQWQVGEFTATQECCLQTFHPKCQAMGFTSTGQETGVTSTEFIVSTKSPPTTTPLCDSGSMKSEDCRMFFCQDGQWQVGEFTATRECCLQAFHPKCQAMGFTSTGQATDVTYTEFMVNNETPPTTQSSHVCDSGSMKVEDCTIFFCGDGQWQVGEFTATKECCLQTFNPKCEEMGFTSTGQVKDVTTTEFMVNNETPPTTQSSHVCDSGSMKVEDCIIFFCGDGQWQVGEFTATTECCLQTFNPKCEETGFTTTGQVKDVTTTELIVTTESPPTTRSSAVCDSGSTKAEDCRILYCQDGQWVGFFFNPTQECCLQTYYPMCQAMGFTTTGQATGLTSIEFIVTTESPTITTSTPLCDSGLMKAEDCRIFVCQDGQWQVGEFTATKECCLQIFHPKCQVMGFTTAELTSTTIATTTLTPTCEFGSGRIQDCTIYVCVNGELEPFEFAASEECCLKESHPMCSVLGFTAKRKQSANQRITGGQVGLSSPVSSSSTGTPNTDCSSDSSHVQDCGIYVCENGQWQLFEFFASDECCEKEFHPRLSSSSTGSPNSGYSPDSSHVQECGIYICENGQWQLFEFFVSEECCVKEIHPTCTALITRPQDDRSPKDWPLNDSDYSEEVLDVLLIRLPLFPVLPFPVADRNGRHLNSHKDTSGGRT